MNDFSNVGLLDTKKHVSRDYFNNFFFFFFENTYFQFILTGTMVAYRYHCLYGFTSF